MPRARSRRVDVTGLLRVGAVAAGGALGTLGRYGIGAAVGGAATGFPWGTFIVNAVGSFLLGALVVLIAERWPPTTYAAPFAAVGFCGGFTTFSTFAVELVDHTRHGAPGTAAVYLVATLAVGLLSAFAGGILARPRPGGHLRHSPDAAPVPDTPTRERSAP